MCRRGLNQFDRLRSFGAFDGALRELIHLLKYSGVMTLATPLAALLAVVVHNEPELAAVDVVVPVPLHPRRQRARGYNQAECLARKLAELLVLPLDTRSFARRRNTAPQTGLTPRQRRANVRGAFAVRARSQLDAKRILLVDDVCTTGATLNACAQTLKRAGASEVQAITLARVVQWIPGLRDDDGNAAHT